MHDNKSLLLSWPSCETPRLGPPEAGHDPPGDVLDGPEVEGEEQDDGHEAADEALGEPAAEEVGCKRVVVTWVVRP